ncbi:hypothetical protein RMCBS344292_04896 [Rhizopus microsporus]|nr:hypothetical protein RMCBS344292_04896 [Rhizopus microsporus]
MHNNNKNNILEENSWQIDNRNDPIFGQDSIEITAEDLYNQSDLTERIQDAEKRFSTSSITTSYFSSERFEYPAVYRVLFMGAAEQEVKKRLLEKLGQGFIHVLLDKQRGIYGCFSIDKTLTLYIVWGDQPIAPFREIKHNLVPLNNYYLDQRILSASYEEYGVSIIEADFTWTSTAAECSDDPAQLLLHYAWKQCPNPYELPSAHLGNDLPSEFQGTMCPDKTPNGIDLCVYVYDDENDDRTRRDMQLLYKIRKLGIYVLPLTLSRSEEIKSYFAKVLTQYQVPCLDLSTIQIGRQPSFLQYKKAATVDRLSRIQEMECREQLNRRPAVASYQILAVDQFCAIENTSILELLKRTRDREVERDENKRQDYRSLLPSATNSVESEEEQKKPVDTTQSDRYPMISILIIAILGILCAIYFASFNKAPEIWTARFEMMNRSDQIILVTRDPMGQLSWSRTDPMIWLNEQERIPIEKMSTGYYQLIIDNVNNSHILTFHVNTTDEHIIYFGSRTTFYNIAPTVNTRTVIEDVRTNVNSPPSQQEQQNQQREKFNLRSSFKYYLSNLKIVMKTRFLSEED